MSIKVVLIPTIEEQREDPARKDSVVDPAGIDLERSQDLSVMNGYDFSRHPIPLGMAHNIRLEDGRIVADLDMKVGWAGNVVESHMEGDITVIDHMELIHTTLSPNPAEEA